MAAIAATEGSFSEAVLEASRERPVVVQRLQ